MDSTHPARLYLAFHDLMSSLTHDVKVQYGAEWLNHVQPFSQHGFSINVFLVGTLAGDTTTMDTCNMFTSRRINCQGVPISLFTIISPLKTCMDCRGCETVKRDKQLWYD